MKSLRCSVSPRLAHSLVARHPGLPLSRAHDGRAEGRERVPVTATDPSALPRRSRASPLLPIVDGSQDGFRTEANLFAPGFVGLDPTAEIYVAEAHIPTSRPRARAHRIRVDRQGGSFDVRRKL